jgi:hypothetical protein
VLEGSHEVAEGRRGEEDGGGDEARGARDDGQPLHDGHDAVGARAHVVTRDLADGGVKGGRGRADAQQQRDLDEEDDKGRDAVVCSRV